MPRGQPDFGMYAAKEIGASLADMAELAVRLGSIAEYDRRGDVIYLDDYESPLERFKKGGSAGCSALLDSTVAYSRAQCVKLATGGVINDYYELYYYLAPLTTGKHGSRIALSPYEMDDHNGTFEIMFQAFDGSHFHKATIELNPYNKTLKCWLSSLAMYTFETNFLISGHAASLFHNIKVVIDLDTGKYVRFLFNNLSWDISAYSYQKDTNDTAPRALAIFGLTDLEGYAFGIYQDDFVYTINEP